ncbi:CreA family protein [Fuscovulum blasticum]|uniref:CreA family protein n=1 Tax=Fuscovulum blasticum TaxID=1075 RepID=UPI000D3EC50C|nr:CreA family protein [Fuscovulum blasticum]AWD22692.1 CREA protein [Fuscovulum blasticum]
MRLAAPAVTLGLALSALPAMAEEVGRVGVDWVGNDIIIEAIPDPKVQGVTCHLAYFERSIYDRLTNGNWFEDPSYSAVDCTQTGPITLGDIDTGEDGEKVFSERQSLILKTLEVTRIYDARSNALIYLAHASEITQGSGKMSISVIPLPAGVAP